MAAGNIAISEPETSAATSRHRRALVELGVGYALILIVIWTPRPWQKLSYAVAASFLGAVLWISRAGWQAMGLRPANFARSLWLIAAALLVAAIADLVASRMHTLHGPDSLGQFIARYTGYAIGACMQQILLQNFFLPRLLRLMRGPGTASLAAAALFSLAHLPNPLLTVITFFWGFAACLFFVRCRNLYTLAIAHTILGVTVAMTVPGPVIRNMRVGLGYVTFNSHPAHHHNH